jgi:hypothetical protein
MHPLVAINVVPKQALIAVPDDSYCEPLQLPLSLELLRDDAHQQQTFSLFGILATHPLGLALSSAYSIAQKEHHQYERLSRCYKDGRKDLSWLSLSRYVQHLLPGRATMMPLAA